ncbi:hypothetical protein K491DRAFT_332870 [Lophiostoma macrostomum CBS 122681]|uniref:Zn(2)-C6 fungal-type domain-containing protein n=1 Tax=Lophiostoma macrostomum CBS 122681 TaxID=1314788 RepID=A0A6A6TQ01_9PLEO|nr:hypothetical protein K491DRAFT_332870 [Lophiostoma macrostomum CBS 122681]
MHSEGACQSCRTRRIKCDERKPVCLRCIKAQRPCVEAGLAKQELFTIHSENNYANGKQKRPRGPRSSLVSLQPSFSLAARAQAYYVQNHFQVFPDIPDVATTWSECFHEWKAAGKSSPIVDLSFSSLALSVFARSQKSTSAAVEASTSYAQLLREMQRHMLRVRRVDVDADEIDAYLLTVYFMARYESYLKQHTEEAEPINSMKLWFHFDGAAAILKMWYNNRHRYIPTTIVKQSRRTLVKSSLLRGHEPCWLKDGDIFGEKGIALEFDHLTIQAIGLNLRCSRRYQESQRHSLDSSVLDALHQDARMLDKTIEDWSTQLPSKWAYRTHTLSGTHSFPEDEFFSGTVLSCTTHGFAAVWTEYFAIRMLIVNSRLRILSLSCGQLGEAFSQERSECIAQLNSFANSLASFVPSSLDRVRATAVSASDHSIAPVEFVDEPLKAYLANLVVWPLSLASSLQEVDPGQRQWFRSRLSWISSSSSECLIAYAMSDYWTVL